MQAGIPRAAKPVCTLKFLIKQHECLSHLPSNSSTAKYVHHSASLFFSWIYIQHQIGTYLALNTYDPETNTRSYAVTVSRLKGILLSFSYLSFRHFTPQRRIDPTSQCLWLHLSTRFFRKRTPMDSWLPPVSSSSTRASHTSFMLRRKLSCLLGQHTYRMSSCTTHWSWL